MAAPSATAVPVPGASEYRALMERVEKLIDTIDLDDRTTPRVEKLVVALVEGMGKEMGFSGGRLYVAEGEDFRLWSTFGEAKVVKRGARLSREYPTVQECLLKGSLYVPAGDPRQDPRLERRLGTGPFAAVVVGDEAYLLSLDLAPGHREEIVLFSLGLLRHSINSNIRDEHIHDVLREARRIQSSILPKSFPVFGGYDIAGRSDPLETVGGDFLDFLPISDKILGLAIADVSGHGLPAALQVRDIYMGLRMGTARDFKIVRTVERLNQIINQSTLTGRFVSMVYGELEIDGTFIYVNAGHPAPFHLSTDGEMSYLEKGGVVLGPIPQASYQRGYLTMRPGDLLVLYTDGIVEASCEDHQTRIEYGVERLVAVTRAHCRQSAAEIVEAIFADVDSFCVGVSPSDDRTVSVVKLPT